jgi:hypothetical protein
MAELWQSSRRPPVWWFRTRVIQRRSLSIRVRFGQGKLDELIIRGASIGRGHARIRP